MKYEYTVWDLANDEPVGEPLDSLYTAWDRRDYQQKHGPWSGERDFTVYRRPLVAKWEPL